MSFLSMATELSGMVPRIPIDYCFTVVNRALLDAYRKSLWSFNTFESNWTTPVWIQTGTVSVTQGQSTIQFDPLAATVAINAVGLVPSPVTKRQLRIGVGTIYNIWAYSAPSGTVNTSGTDVTWVSGTTFTDGVGGAWVGLKIGIAGVSYTIASVANNGLSLVLTSSAGSQSGAAFQMGGIATLDRAYQEVTAAASGYTIFQCYYASPVRDFKSWASIRDMLNYNELFTNKSRAWIDLQDPQRTFYYIPTHVVFYQDDQNPASSTYGYPMFEIWGSPTYVLTYQLYGYRKGAALVNPADELPNALGEDCVMAKARKYVYEWAEANREKIDGRQNFMQLKRDADIDFERLYKSYRKDDRALFDAFHTKFRRSRTFPNQEPSYNSISGYASPGAP